MQWFSAISSWWEAKPEMEFPKTVEDFEALLLQVGAGVSRMSGHFPHMPGEAEALKEMVHRTSAALIWSQEHVEVPLWATFHRMQGLDILVHGVLEHATSPRVRKQLWQSLAILSTCVTTKYEHFLLQGAVLNYLFTGQPELTDEDNVGYYSLFSRRLAMRVDASTSRVLLLDKRCPLFEEAAKMVFHKEQLASSTSRVTITCMLQIKEVGDEVKCAVLEGLRGTLLPLLVDRLRGAWDVAGAELRKAVPDDAAFNNAMGREKDAVSVLVDLLSLKDPEVTQAIAQQVVVGALLPHLHLLAAKKPLARSSQVLDIFGDQSPPVIAPSPSQWDAWEEMPAPSPTSPGTAAWPVFHEPDDLDVALAVRSLACFVDLLRAHGMAGIMVPFFQLLLFPELPAALLKEGARSRDFKEARRELATLCAASCQEGQALFGSKALPLPDCERRHHWRASMQGTRGVELPGEACKEKVHNPFWPAIRALMDSKHPLGGSAASKLHIRPNASAGTTPAAIAFWLLDEIKDSAYPEIQHDAGHFRQAVETPPAPKPASGWQGWFWW